MRKKPRKRKESTTVQTDVAPGIEPAPALAAALHSTTLGVGPIPERVPPFTNQTNIPRSSNVPKSGDAPLDHTAPDSAGPPQASSTSTKLRKAKKSQPRAACNIWICLQVLKTDEEPSEKPNPETEKEIFTGPDAPFRVDGLELHQWNDNALLESFGSKPHKGMVAVVQDKGHQSRGKWAHLLKEGELANKSWSGTVGDSTPAQEPFSSDGFLDRMMQWLKSVNVIENRFFHKLLVFVSNGVLTNSKIPHHTKIMTLIQRVAALEQQQLEKEMQLCAFRHVSDRHTRVILRKAIVKILKELGVLERLGYITMDNASNCHTLVDQIAAELEALNIRFTREQNCICCFPHTVNLGIQDFLNHLSKELQPEVIAIYDGCDLPQWSS
ncbi:hypothetical protein FRB90_002944 [Tulasnella sp. 427]|nr:hypothetical protein FRB90_002944 [Tulasnella sp. 427]